MQRAHDSVQVTRWIIDQPAPPTFVKVGNFTGNVDRWQIIDFTPPAFLRLDVGATPTGTGAPEGRRVGGIGMRNLNAITPETETTSHYFWGQAHDFDVAQRGHDRTGVPADQDRLPGGRRGVHRAAANMTSIPTAPQIDINADSGGIQARRIVDRLYAEEQAGRRSRPLRRQSSG